MNDICIVTYMLTYVTIEFNIYLTIKILN